MLAASPLPGRSRLISPRFLSHFPETAERQHTPGFILKTKSSKARSTVRD